MLQSESSDSALGTWLVWSPELLAADRNYRPQARSHRFREQASVVILRNHSSNLRVDGACAATTSGVFFLGHFYEAVLATLAIIVRHFYQVIFDPYVYPVNFAFIDGRLSEESYKEEHELAYEQLKKQAEQEEVKTEEATLDERSRD